MMFPKRRYVFVLHGVFWYVCYAVRYDDHGFGLLYASLMQSIALVLMDLMFEHM